MTGYYVLSIYCKENKAIYLRALKIFMFLVTQFQPYIDGKLQRKVNNPDNRSDGLSEIIISTLPYLAQYYQTMRPSVSKTHSGTARRFRVSLGLCVCYINEYKLIFSDENDIFSYIKFIQMFKKRKQSCFIEHSLIGIIKQGAIYIGIACNEILLQYP